MRSPCSVPYRSVSSVRKSCHWRRVSAMAPDTALAKLSPTMPRGVVGSVARPVTGSIRPLSLLSAAWVTRAAHCPDAGDLVLHHEAAGREVRGHARGRPAAQVEHRARPGQVQTRRVLVPDGTGRVRLVGPVAVRVEVLRPVQYPPESFEGRALGAVLRRVRAGCTPGRGSPRPRSPGPGRRGGPSRCPRPRRTARASGRRSPMSEAVAWSRVRG